MQDLGMTPLCQITHSENMIATHKKFFASNFCLKCRQVPGKCECKEPKFSNPTYIANK